MADTKFFSEYCIVSDKDTDKVILAKQITARVETNHKMKKYTKLEDIPKADMDKIKEYEKTHKEEFKEEQKYEIL